MKHFKYLILFFLITVPAIASNSEPSNSDPDWGLGVITPQKIINLDFKINLPEQPISLYEKPAGSKTGSLFKSNEYELSYRGTATSSPTIVSSLDFSEVDYQGFCLIYYQKVNDFVNILTHTVKGGFWVSVKELAAVNYQTVDWRNFLLNNFRGYHPLDKNGLSLYDKAASNNKTIALLKGDLYVITLTGKTKEQWAEALVQLYDKEPCDGGTVVKEYKGWLKIINEKQYPSIWINTEGC